MNKKDKFKYVYRSESVLSQLFSNFGDLFLVEGFSEGVGLLDSLFVPFFGSLSSLAFQFFDKVLLSPSDLAGQITQLTELSEAAQLDGSEGIRNNLFLLGVVGSWDSFKDFQSSEGSSANCLLVGEHASDGSPDHS
jgi:hypothetical protein